MWVLFGVSYIKSFGDHTCDQKQTTIRERQICTCPRCGNKMVQVDSVLLQVFKRSIDNVRRLLMKLKTDIKIMNSLCWLTTYEKKDNKMNLRFSL